MSMFRHLFLYLLLTRRLCRYLGRYDCFLFTNFQRFFPLFAQIIIHHQPFLACSFDSLARRSNVAITCFAQMNGVFGRISRIWRMSPSIEARGTFTPVRVTELCRNFSIVSARSFAQADLTGTPWPDANRAPRWQVSTGLQWSEWVDHRCYTGDPSFLSHKQSRLLWRTSSPRCRSFAIASCRTRETQSRFRDCVSCDLHPISDFPFA